MAKPRLFHRNRLNPEEPGDGAEEEGGAEVGKRTCVEGGEGKERTSHDTPPLPPADLAAGAKRSNRPDRGE